MGDLVFEPIISLSTSCLIGVEARMLLDVPVPAREDPWALRDACRRSAEWNGADPVTPIVVSVDAPAEQFRDGFAHTVRDAVDDAGADPGCVCVEVTEQTLMVDPHEASRILGELRDSGVSVTIDHFGSGYSSLDSLTRMAVGAIKIPPSFISGSVANDTAMVASVIGLAHAMELRVIVEGVETTDQLACLRELGCDAAQGPCVGIPLSAAETMDHVADARAGRTLTARSRSQRRSAAVRRRTVAPAPPTARADPALFEMLHAAHDRGRRGSVAGIESLSPRQLEIVGRLLDGERVPAIARDLYVSASTVRNHLSNVFRKWGVNSQEEMLALLRSVQVAQENTLEAERASREHPSPTADPG